MTVTLTNGGTLTVTDSGTVEYRRGREYSVTPGCGDRASNLAWLSSLAMRNGKAVLYTVRTG